MNGATAWETGQDTERPIARNEREQSEIAQNGMKRRKMQSNTKVSKKTEKTAWDEAQAHPMIMFVTALDQLQEDHETLRHKLDELPALANSIRDGNDTTDWYGTLLDLRSRVEAFLLMLEEHAEWEEQALFPTVALYAGDNIKAHEVLEADHRLAVQYMEAFLDELSRQVAPLYRAAAASLMALLMNAWQLLRKHFHEEEQWIYPIADQIREDIDYLSC